MNPIQVFLALLLFIWPTQETPYEQALAAIEAAAATNATELNLSQMGLTHLPPEIGGLTQLRTLTLYGNQLTTLPPEIGQLSQLQNLDVSLNRLLFLPPEIGGLTELRELSLSANLLTTLPPEIGGLTRLRALYLNQNPISNLPLTRQQMEQVTVRARDVPHFEAFRYGDGVTINLQAYFSYPRPPRVVAQTWWLTISVLAGCMMLAVWLGVRYLRWLGRR